MWREALKVAVALAWVLAGWPWATVQAADEAKPWATTAKEKIGGSVVRISLKQASAKEALGAMEAQAGTRFVTEPGSLLDNASLGRADVNIDGRNFWESLEVLCRVYGLTADPHSAPIKLQRCEPGQPMGLFQGRPTAASGPFLVTANGADRVHKTGYLTGQTPRRQCRVEFSVWSEPKLRVLAVVPLVSVEEAVDERGKPIKPVEIPPGHVFLAPSSGTQHGVTALLDLGDGKCQQFARLSGKAWIALGSQFEQTTLEVGLKGPGAEAMLAGRRIKVVRIEKTERELEPPRYDVEVTMTVRRQREPVQGPERFARFALLDANGRTLATRPVQEPAVQDVDVHTWKLEFWGYGDDGEKVGPPVRMTVELPVAMQAVEVPFAFRDLPIP